MTRLKFGLQITVNIFTQFKYTQNSDISKVRLSTVQHTN